MQKLMGLVRRCVDDYKMIEAGDRIAVGVSGGKDSLVLLVLLAGLKKYFNKPFELEAITIDMGLGMDYSGIQALLGYNYRKALHLYNIPNFKCQQLFLKKIRKTWYARKCSKMLLNTLECSHLNFIKIWRKPNCAKADGPDAPLY